MPHATIGRVVSATLFVNDLRCGSISTQLVLREGEEVAVRIGEPGDFGGVAGRGPDAVGGLFEEAVAGELDAFGGEVGYGGVDVTGDIEKVLTIEEKATPAP